MVLLTGQQRWWRERLRAIKSPLLVFFCVVKHRLTQVAWQMSRSGAVTRSSRRCPAWRQTSLRVKAALLLVVPVCSPGQRRKKKARHVTSTCASSAGEVAGIELASSSRKVTRVVGHGRTLVGEGLCLFHPECCQPSQRSILLFSASRIEWDTCRHTRTFIVRSKEV